jgi:hypothetical protein
LTAGERLPLAESIRNLQRSTGAAFEQIELVPSVAQSVKIPGV